MGQRGGRQNLGISTIVTAVAVVLLLVLLIFPHELGHFLAAKACNVQVNEFAFGMGPAIFQHQGKETLYSIRAIPIGGYCKMEGEDFKDDGETHAENVEVHHNPRAFNNKKWWQKIIILVGGAAMNFFIAIVAMSIVMAVVGIGTNQITHIQKDSPAYEAKLQPGDIIKKVDGHTVNNQKDILTRIQNKKTVQLTIGSKEEEKIVSLTPHYNQKIKMNVIGVNLQASHNPIKAVGYGTKATVYMTGQVFRALKNLFSPGGIKQVSGPVGMVNMVSQANQLGWTYYMQLLALISVNLGLFNLLPLPALDGGRILFVLIRKIFGKAITDKTETYVHAVGMVMLLGLMVYVTWNDILRLFK